MTTIEVYPSNLPGEPLETHTTNCATLHEWLVANCPSYRLKAEQPVSASVGNVIVPPEQWLDLKLTGQTVQIRPNPRDPMTILYVAAAVLVVSVVLRPKIPNFSTQQQGKKLESANIQANTPRLNGVIPEIAGTYKWMPDYLSQPHRYFNYYDVQTLEVLLCLGVGSFDVHELYMGDTKFSEFGDKLEYTIFQPGANVLNENVFNATEVANTTFSAGLRLTATSDEGGNSTGYPSILTGSAVADLNYASSPVTFLIRYVGDKNITLNQNYANAGALVAAIQAVIDNDPAEMLTVSHNAGVIVFTAQDNRTLEILKGGSFTRVLGSLPTSVVGRFDGGKWIGPYAASPINQDVTNIEVDVFCPNGLGVVTDSGINNRKINFEVEWSAQSGRSGIYSFSIEKATRDQIGRTIPISLFNYEKNVLVRMRRIEMENTTTSSLDRVEWYGLKSTGNSAIYNFPGVTTMKVKLIGAGDLSSRAENRVQVLATRKLNGVATRSIAEWVRYVAADIGYSTADLNEVELNALATVWNSRGDTFDFAQVDQTTVKETLAMALRAGFAELTIDGGKIRPVRDQVRTTFEHLYTPQNMTEPLKRQFVSYDPDDFDGVDVEFTSAQSWETETVQCRLSGDAGLRVERIKLDGVTDRTRAWRIGMRQRRAQVYRRKQYAWSTEWDALNSRYLSYCAVSDDVPGYGQSAILRRLVVGSGAVALTSSEPLVWASGVTHVVALRRPDGTLFGPQTATRVDDYRLTIPGPLDFTPVFAGAVEPTHILFGTVTNWSYPVLVTDISPSGDTVDVTAVNYDARIYADDDNSPT
jgi:hypothetical protein